jgi:5-methylcytosine-specific restriction protein B
MNTADRSIALLDVALRRRFYFKELEPDAEVIRRNNPEVMQKIRVPELLTVLSVRITEKLDRDHRIGHAQGILQKR